MKQNFFNLIFSDKSLGILLILMIISLAGINILLNYEESNYMRKWDNSQTQITNVSVQLLSSNGISYDKNNWNFNNPDLGYIFPIFNFDAGTFSGINIIISYNNHEEQLFLNFSDISILRRMETRNVMIYDGVLTSAFTEESLRCWSDNFDISLKPINYKEASILTNEEWIFYQDVYYKIVSSKQSNKCSNKLVFLPDSEVIIKPIKINQEIKLNIIGNISPSLFDNSNNEIYPEIILSTPQLINEDTLNLTFSNNEGTFNKKILIQNDSFFIHEKLKVFYNSKFLFPFDRPYSIIGNISPNKIQVGEEDVELKQKDLNGKAYFHKDKIKIVFNRNWGNRFKVIFNEILLFTFLLILKHNIKFLRKNSINTKKFSKIFFGALSIIGCIAIISNYGKFLVNVLIIIPLIVFVKIVILSIKKISRLSKR